MTRKEISGFFLVLFLFFFFPCSAVAGISASSITIYAGESATITWNYPNSYLLFFIYPLGVRATNGSEVVTPLQTTTYIAEGIDWNYCTSQLGSVTWIPGNS